MMNIKNIEATQHLSHLKQLYMRHTTAPLDGMWLCGLVPLARHYGLYEASELAGFCCVNEDGYLLQFLMDPKYQQRSSELFASIVHGDLSAGEIKGAFASTAEPEYLSLCADHYSSITVNALMYQLADTPWSLQSRVVNTPLAMSAVEAPQLAEAVEFAMAAIGAPPEWLTGYYANLIDRHELFGLWEEGRLIAAGESRGYDDYQTDYADVGVIVAASERSRGLATRVLKHLIAMNEEKSLSSICSTEAGNIAAQKAITRAGFLARNRILQFND